MRVGSLLILYNMYFKDDPTVVWMVGHFSAYTYVNKWHVSTYRARRNLNENPSEGVEPATPEVDKVTLGYTGAPFWKVVQLVQFPHI